MKRCLKLSAVIMALIMVMQCCTIAFAQSKSKSDYTGKTYTHQSRFDDSQRLNGIDVSEHNGNINFKKVKADGINFVFVRVGYTGYTKSKHSLNYDKNYKTNIKNALDAGLAVGVYWYSQAVNVNEARAEANKILTALKGYNINMPVVMDYEFADRSSGRLDSAHLSKAAKTKNALAFLDEVSKAGYDGCLYANKSFLEDEMNYKDISKNYKIWLAHYTTNTTFSGEIDYWQYSETGYVDGISGKCDMNFWYFYDVTDLPSVVYTGKAITPKPIVEYNKKTLKENVDYTLTYKNNVKIGTATVTAVGMGNYANKQFNYKFDIIPESVTELDFVTRDSDSLKYSWSAVRGATKYYVWCKNNSTGKAQSFTTTAKSATITNLSPATEYTVKVRAMASNAYGANLYSKPSSADVKRTIADKVTGLKATSRTKSQITFTWNKKSGCIGYRVYRYYANSTKYDVADLKGYSSNTYTLKNLYVGETVYIRVSAITRDTKNSLGYRSDRLVESTRPETVTVSGVTSPSAKKVKANWKKVACNGYQIQYSTSNSFKSYKTVNVSSKYVASTFAVPKSKTVYYVRVRSYKTLNDQKIYGYWSSTYSVKSK